MHSTDQHSGKTALITGAAKGIGRACARRLAAGGADLILLDVDEPGLQALADEIGAAGGRCSVHIVDLMQTALIHATLDGILAGHGRIDILVNNAGGGWHRLQAFADSAADDWEWILDLNVKSLMHVTRHVLTGMLARGSGRIINIASVAASTGIARAAVYAASKAAVVGFSRSLAMEVGEQGITVNTVSPGLVSTQHSQASQGTFLGRNGTADEVAALIDFLSGDDAAYITGADYLIDGGRSLGPRGA